MTQTQLDPVVMTLLGNWTVIGDCWYCGPVVIVEAIIVAHWPNWTQWQTQLLLDSIVDIIGVGIVSWLVLLCVVVLLLIDYWTDNYCWTQLLIVW